jgi:hypothetical protein
MIRKERLGVASGTHFKLTENDFYSFFLGNKPMYCQFKVKKNDNTFAEDLDFLADPMKRLDSEVLFLPSDDDAGDE